MGIFSKIAEATKDIAYGAHGFARGLLEGTTKGNSIGSLVGIGVGVALALTGIISGGLVPALVMGVGLGAAAGVVAGGLAGSMIGAAKNGHERRMAKSEQLATTQAPEQPMQEAAAAPAMPQMAMAPAVKTEPAISFQNRIAMEREAKAQEASASR